MKAVIIYSGKGGVGKTTSGGKYLGTFYRKHV